MLAVFLKYDNQIQMLDTLIPISESQSTCFFSKYIGLKDERMSVVILQWYGVQQKAEEWVGVIRWEKLWNMCWQPQDLQAALPVLSMSLHSNPTVLQKLLHFVIKNCGVLLAVAFHSLVIWDFYLCFTISVSFLLQLACCLGNKDTQLMRQMWGAAWLAQCQIRDTIPLQRWSVPAWAWHSPREAALLCGFCLLWSVAELIWYLPSWCGCTVQQGG